MARVRQALQCAATSKTTGERCRKYAIVGGTVCPSHGGSAPQVRRRAAMRVAERAEWRHVQKILDRNRVVDGAVAPHRDDAFWAEMVLDTKTMRRIAKAMTTEAKAIRERARQIDAERQGQGR